MQKKEKAKNSSHKKDLWKQYLAFIEMVSPAGRYHKLSEINKRGKNEKPV